MLNVIEVCYTEYSKRMLIKYKLRGLIMAKVNYNYEKRAREIEKEKKKEEKRKKKLAKNNEETNTTENDSTKE